ncbi:cytochrome c oxidase assembly factor 3, mitochondrial [Leptopilina boulardi]|uniref:cytochrome c oxidase assembly factor 3, mitochondrial n=1 Tax=Leptopilina boulardi TaxID=63433 RepID=UPI0021F64E0D|nr:cytochrome c oxidase assembly factor 3, mitochondrial [Leptopilina boulardi]
MTDNLQKVNIKTDRKLTPTDLINIKRIEEINRKRVARVKIVQKKNIFTALSLAALAGGIYIYTIKSMKQEEFLDDFNEPEKITVG